MEEDNKNKEPIVTLRFLQTAKLYDEENNEIVVPKHHFVAIGDDGMEFLPLGDENKNAKFFYKPKEKKS
jgi:hypothetical protein